MDGLTCDIEYRDERDDHVEKNCLLDECHFD